MPIESQSSTEANRQPSRLAIFQILMQQDMILATFQSQPNNTLLTVACKIRALLIGIIVYGNKFQQRTEDLRNHSVLVVTPRLIATDFTQQNMRLLCVNKTHFKRGTRISS